MYSIPFTLVLIKLWSFVSYYDFLKKKKKGLRQLQFVSLKTLKLVSILANFTQI